MRDRANNVSRFALVAWIGVGEQERDRDRLDAARHEVAYGALHVGAVERQHDLAAEIEPLAHLENAVALEQHLGRRRKDVEHLLAAPLAADLVDVAKARRGQKPDAHTLVLKQRVERRGRAVQDQRHRVGAEFLHEVARDLVHHPHRIGRVRCVLADRHDLRLLVVEGGDVGKGAADVDPDADAHSAALPLRSAAVAASSTERSSGLSATP